MNVKLKGIATDAAAKAHGESLEKSHRPVLAVSWLYTTLVGSGTSLITHQMRAYSPDMFQELQKCVAQTLLECQAVLAAETSTGPKN